MGNLQCSAGPHLVALAAAAQLLASTASSMSVRVIRGIIGPSCCPLPFNPEAVICLLLSLTRAARLWLVGKGGRTGGWPETAGESVRGCKRTGSAAACDDYESSMQALLHERGSYWIRGRQSTATVSVRVCCVSDACTICSTHQQQSLDPLKTFACSYGQCGHTAMVWALVTNSPVSNLALAAVLDPVTPSRVCCVNFTML